MKKGLIILAILITGLGTFFYLTNPDIKSRMDNWMGIAPQGSIQQHQPDSISANKNSARKPSKRKRTPKTVKPDKYAHLDKYARETPSKYSQSTSKLAEYLKKPAKNDLEKARVIYSWIATHIHYDDDGFNSNRYKDQNADSVLARRTAVCEGFSSLFQKLGLLMDLKVEKIVGYAKGYGYKSGDTFSDTDHAWNAVKIGDTWKLIDVTWGSSAGETTKKGLLKSKIAFDPYWFCVPPEAFIFSHLPENKDWQLTHSTITLKQFEILPYVNHCFFKLGFDPQQIFERAISGSTHEFVETFPIDYPINGATLPFTKKIQRGKEYTFSIESEYIEEVAIIEGEQWTTLKKDGNIFRINHTPTGDELSISIKVNWYDNFFHTIVVYEIVNAENLTAHNDLHAPKDSRHKIAIAR